MLFMMEKHLNQIIGYLINVIQLSFNQLLIIFGPLLVLVLILNFSAILTARLSLRFWGRNIFLYGFGWLGCSVHELSHAFFALIFGHKIKEMVLFEPNSKGESLGHVSHTFNKKSIYQKIGNFFIGIGPLLAGGLVLLLINLILYRINISEFSKFRISAETLLNFQIFKQIAISTWSGLIVYKNLVTFGNSEVWWKSALLIYVLYSIGSSMTLSKPDVKGALAGFMWIVIFILIFNMLTLWAGDFSTRFLIQGKTMTYISVFYFFLILSFLANLIFILLFFVLNLLKSLLFHQK